jgi:pilus assembly protein CpaB
MASISNREGRLASGKNALYISLLLASLAGVAAFSSVRLKQRKVEDRWATVRILCAKTDVAEGTELTHDMVAIREIPAQFVTASFVKVDEEGKPVQENPVGQRVAVPLKAGDPILVSQFEAARESDFSTMISPNGRAVTIDVQEKSAVGLWVRPNDHVDVVGSFRDPASHELKTITLLQNVIVLATGRITANTVYVADDDKKFQTVTLLVLPEEAQMLTLGQELGQLTLLLRNPGDLDLLDKRSVVDERALFTGERTTELQQKRYRTIQIIRGNKTELAGISLRGKE